MYSIWMFDTNVTAWQLCLKLTFASHHRTARMLNVQIEISKFTKGWQHSEYYLFPVLLRRKIIKETTSTARRNGEEVIIIEYDETCLGTSRFHIR